MTYIIQSERLQKFFAQQIRRDAATKGDKISHGVALNRMAHKLGFADWNTLTASCERPKTESAKDEQYKEDLFVLFIEACEKTFGFVEARISERFMLMGGSEMNGLIEFKDDLSRRYIDMSLCPAGGTGGDVVVTLDGDWDEALLNQFRVTNEEREKDNASRLVKQQIAVKSPLLRQCRDELLTHMRSSPTYDPSVKGSPYEVATKRAKEILKRRTREVDELMNSLGATSEEDLAGWMLQTADQWINDLSAVPATRYGASTENAARTAI